MWREILYYVLMVGGLLGFSYWSAVYSKQSNEGHLSASGFVFGIGILFNFIWTACTIFSKRLLFDAILYDICITAFYTISLIMVGAAQGFSLINWIGFIVVLLGMVLLKV